MNEPDPRRVDITTKLLLSEPVERGARVSVDCPNCGATLAWADKWALEEARKHNIHLLRPFDAATHHIYNCPAYRGEDTK